MIVWHRRETDAQRTLVCFHHAGGGPIAYKEWPKQISVDVNIGAAVVAGRDRRFGTPLPTDLDAVADEMAEVIRDECNDTWTLFGHSMGAVIAFEVCRRLELTGNSPGQLIVSGASPPGHQNANRHRLPDNALWDDLRAMGGTSQEIFDHPELMEVLLPIVRADLKLVESFAPKKAELAIPITAVCGNDDYEVYAEKWSSWTHGAFQTKTFDGGHFYLDEYADQVLPWLEGLVKR